MEHFNGSDHPTVYHGAYPPEVANGRGSNVFHEHAGLTKEDVRALAGGLPRMFALIQDYGDPDGEGVAEVVAYGDDLAGPAGRSTHARRSNGGAGQTEIQKAAIRSRRRGGQGRPKDLRSG